MQQPQKAEAEAPSKQPEAELPQDDQDAPEDREGPMNEQAGDGAQQQDFTTPEACTSVPETREPVASLLYCMEGNILIIRSKALFCHIQDKTVPAPDSTHICCGAGNEEAGSAICAGATAGA